MPIFNKEIIEIMRKKPNIDYSTTGPSKWAKGVVLKALFENPESSRRKLCIVTGMGDATVVSCLNSFEDRDFVLIKPIRLGVNVYSTMDDEEVIEQVKHSIESAPKTRPETQTEKAARRIQTKLKSGSKTKKMLVKALAMDHNSIDIALKTLQSDGVINRIKNKEAKKKNAPLVYTLV